MAFSGGGLVGTVAAWDQRGYRQSVVTGYSPAAGVLRPAYNVAARLWRYPALPPPGSQLDYCYLSLVCIKDNSTQTFAAMLNELMQRHRLRQSFVVAGFHERDPLLSVLRRYPRFSYPSRLYVVSWQDGEAEFQRLDRRIPYLEVGAL
jgi:hypothetical protein